MQSQETRTESIHNAECGCGKPAVKWSMCGWVCAECIELERICHENNLLNDRWLHPLAERGKKIPNPEYLKRYSKAYHANRHLPKAERCALARLAASLPLVVHEEREAALCACGYPALAGETKCCVCKHVMVYATKRS